MCFQKHPFQDAQFLAIINAHYYFPAPSEYPLISDKMKDLIRALLTPNPSYRPSIYQLESILDTFYNDNESIKLSEDALEIKKRQLENEKVKEKRLGKTQKVTL